jgi:hypothetical protein
MPTLDEEDDLSSPSNIRPSKPTERRLADTLRGARTRRQRTLRKRQRIDFASTHHTLEVSGLA